MAHKAPPGHHRPRRDPRRGVHRPARSCSPTRSSKTFDDLFADVYDGTDAVVRSARRSTEGFAGAATRGAGSTSRCVDDGGRRRRRGGRRGHGRGLRPDRRQGRRPGRRPGHGRADVRRQLERPPTTLNPFTLVEGRAPAADDEVVIDKAAPTTAGSRSATRHGARPGPAPTSSTLVGIAKFGDADSPGRRHVRAVHRARRRSGLLGEPGKFDSISVVADDGVSQNEVVDRIRDGLARAGVEVAHRRGDHRGDPGRHPAGAVVLQRSSCCVFAVIALSGRRVHHLQHLLDHGGPAHPGDGAAAGASGASRRQVAGSVLVEAWSSAWSAPCVGLAARARRGRALKAARRLRLRAARPAARGPRPRTVVIALVGRRARHVVAALLPGAARLPGPAASPPCATSPSTRSGRVAAAARRRLRRPRAGRGARCSPALFAVGDRASGRPRRAAACSSVVAAPRPRAGPARSAACSARRWPALRGITGELARENAMRNPRRTAATAVGPDDRRGPGRRSSLVLAASVAPVDRRGASIELVQRRLRHRLRQLRRSGGSTRRRSARHRRAARGRRGGRRSRFARPRSWAPTRARDGHRPSGVFDLFDIDVVEGSADLDLGERDRRPGLPPTSEASGSATPSRSASSTTPEASSPVDRVGSTSRDRPRTSATT